jgi:hypothetical protein
MAANSNPLFLLTPKMAWGTVTTANTAMDGTGTVVTIFTGGTNGSLVKEIRMVPLGSNTQSPVRIFINNGSTNATPANNSLFYDTTMATVTGSNTTALLPQVITPGNGLPMDGLFVPNGYKLNVTIGTTVATGIAVAALGGDY